jgi:hypothetical protein
MHPDQVPLGVSEKGQARVWVGVCDWLRLQSDRRGVTVRLALRPRSRCLVRLGEDCPHQVAHIL